MDKNLEPQEPMSLEEFLELLAENNNMSRQRIDQITRAADKAKVPMLELGQFLRTVCTNDEELCYMSLHFGIVFGMKAVQPGA